MKNRLIVKVPTTVVLFSRLAGCWLWLFICYRSPVRVVCMCDMFDLLIEWRRLGCRRLRQGLSGWLRRPGQVL